MIPEFKWHKLKGILLKKSKTQSFRTRTIRFTSITLLWLNSIFINKTLLCAALWQAPAPGKRQRGENAVGQDGTTPCPWPRDASDLCHNLLQKSHFSSGNKLWSHTRQRSSFIPDIINAPVRNCAEVTYRKQMFCTVSVLSEVKTIWMWNN